MYQYKNVIYAGINNEEEFAKWLKNKKPDTGYTFIRILDRHEMGSTISLGMDWSEVRYGLAKQPRQDLPEYYKEIKIEDLRSN